jgi:hypothetical protein
LILAEGDGAGTEGGVPTAVAAACALAHCKQIKKKPAGKKTPLVLF